MSGTTITTMPSVEYTLLQVRAKPEDVDDALRTLSSAWSGPVMAPDIGERWSSVLVTERSASRLAPLLSDLLQTDVVVATVDGDQFRLSSWRPGSAPLVGVDGRDLTAATELARAFSKDPARLQGILSSPAPAAERHAEAAGLLWLPLPTLTGHQPVFDGVDTIQPSALPARTTQVHTRRRVRRIRAILGVVQVVAFLAVDYFWFIEPSTWLVPALAVFIVNGIVLLVLRRFVAPRQPKEQPEQP